MRPARFGGVVVLISDTLREEIERARSGVGAELPCSASNPLLGGEDASSGRGEVAWEATRGEITTLPPPPPPGGCTLAGGGGGGVEATASFAVELEAHTAGKALFCTPSVFPEVAAGSVGLPETSVSVSGLGSHLSGRGPLGGVAERAGELRGAAGALVSVGGSTMSNQVVVRAIARSRPGRMLVVARNVHHSVVHAARAFGVPLRFLAGQSSDPAFESVLPPDPVAVASALGAAGSGGAAAAVVITSPNYEGVIADVAGIAEAVRACSPGTLLIVDQAWGAHLGVAGLPSSAIREGADVVIESTHKLGGAPNQTGLVLWSASSCFGAELRSAYGELVTTSPSFPLVAGLDTALSVMHSPVGVRRVAEVKARVAELRGRVSRLGLVTSGSVLAGRPVDPCRLSINVGPTAKSGFAVADELEARGVVVEKAGIASVLVIVTFQLAADAEDRLVGAFAEMLDAASGERCPASPTLAWDRLPETPEATWDPTGPTVRVPLSEAVGRICAEVVECFPPGIPLLVPGFVITPEAADYIEALTAAGGRVSFDGGVCVAVEPSRARL